LKQKTYIVVATHLLASKMQQIHNVIDATCITRYTVMLHDGVNIKKNKIFHQDVLNSLRQADICLQNFEDSHCILRLSSWFCLLFL